MNISQYPYPIVHAWELAHDESAGAAVRHINAIGCVYQILRLSALPLASWYLYKMPDQPSMNRPLSFLQRPMMGNWIGFIRSALKNVYANQDSSTFRPLCPLIDELNNLFSITWKYENETVDPFSWFIKHRNSHHGHFSTLSDKDAEGALEIVLPKLDELIVALESFSKYQLIHYDVRKGVLLYLHGLDEGESFPEITEFDKSLFHELAEKEEDYIVLYDPISKQLIPLRHLLVQESDEDKFEGIVGFRTASVQLEPLLFDGIERSKESVVYLGSGSRKHRGSNFDKVKSVFEEKLKSIEQSGSYNGVLRLRAESEEQLASVYGSKYLPQTYIIRDTEAKLVKTFTRAANTEGKPVVLLIGNSGSGKSSLLCHLADKFMHEEGEKNQVSLRIAEVVGNETTLSLTQGLAFDLGYRGKGDGFSLNDVLTHWSNECKKLKIKKPRLWILWDAINEGHDFAQLLKWLDDAAKVLQEWNTSEDSFGRVHLIASCRNEPWEQLVYKVKKEDPNAWPIKNTDAFMWETSDEKERVPFWQLKQFSLKQAFSAYEQYKSWAQLSKEPHSLIQWKDISTEQKKIMRKPLNVWLFHQCFHGMETPPLGSLTTSLLWHKYLERLVTKHPLMGDALLIIGEAMWMHQSSLLTVEMIETITREAAFKQQAVVLEAMGLTQIVFDALPEIAQQTLLKSQPGLIEDFNPIELLHSTGLLHFKEDGSITPIYQTLTEALAVWVVWDDLISDWDARSHEKEGNLDIALKSQLASDSNVMKERLEAWKRKATWDEGRSALNYLWAKVADTSITSALYEQGLYYLKELQLRGFTGNVRDIINQHISIIGEEHKLSFQSILIDIVHLRGDYRQAAQMIENELESYPIDEQLSDPMLLSLNIRKVHHKMFFSPIEEVWGTMLKLLKRTDLEKMSDFHGEILVMLGGNLGTLRGNYKEGRDYLIKAIRLGESTGDHYLMTRALRKYFDYLRYEGHFKFAKKYWDKAWALSESKQRTRQGIYMLCSYGDMERQQGNFDDASKCLQEALKASEDTYIPGWIGHCHLALAELAIDKEDLVTAHKELDLAKSFYKVAHQEWGVMHANAGEVRLMQKEGGEWDGLLEEITAKAESLGYMKDIEYFKALASGKEIDTCLMFL